VRLVGSLSGGETSAFMCRKIQLHARARGYTDLRFVFANTGQESEETLSFVQHIDGAWRLGVEWVEAVVVHGEREACGARRVDFASASRNGEPFEEVIRKYGIPNKAYPHCTRELKANPIHAYLRATGWERGSYDTAVGIRVDEFDRMSKDAKEKRFVYPLIDWWPTTKPEINGWWRRQPFRLELKGYQGNCRWCWKKSLRKHFTLLGESPEIYDFPRRMEQEYGHAGHRDADAPDDYRRVFFREGRSVGDLERERAETTWEPATDDAREYGLFDATLDVGEGCGDGEACDPFVDDLGEAA